MRALLSRPAADGPLILPGASDALTARVIEALGFAAVYITGAGVTNARLGMPDLGLMTLTELADTVEAVRNAVQIPIVVDADTGFGGPLNVRRTVQTLERRGANAIQLEDQVAPKRCGHFAGKEVIATAEMVAKLQAALDARGDESLLIIARTDARQTLGLEAALERAERYREAGADVIFVEAPESRDELTEIGRRLPGPLLVNMVEGGATPQLPADELGDLGFSIVLYANAALRGAVHGMRAVLEHLRRTGSTLGALEQMIGWDERQKLVGKPFFDELSDRYATARAQEAVNE
ncbi:MAG TPA: oxaloacetate decarboxylase [Solirubrobacteraceae bacterium]|nr:oxaloacetate decarboxylase [Solirubrobacteraceae bacterium]